MLSKLPQLPTLTLTITLILILSPSQCGKLPIQAHSFNDLNYVSNLIDKGIDYYKLDVSMANRRSCEQHSTWNKSKKCYKTDQYVEEICCLGLRGDASSRPDFGYGFNTSDQLVRFFQATLAKIVAYQPKRRLLFAINFQYGFSFNDFITQQFLSMLADVMTKYPHNLLLGTGSDSFILQYDRICYGKGAPQCNDVRRKISKSNMFLQSGSYNPFDPRDHYKRFRNYNIYYKGIQSHCKHGFPQWINDHPQFPLIFWQPSNQKQIQFVLSWFLSPSCMKLHGRNLSGMAMASNIDPQMFDIYLKKLIQYPSSLSPNPLPTAQASWSLPTQKLLIPQQISLKLTKTTKGPTQTLFTASTNIFTHKLSIQKWEYDSNKQMMKMTGGREYMVLGEGETVWALMQDGTGYLVVVTARGDGMRVLYVEVGGLDVVSSRDWSKMEAVTMKGNQMIYVTCDKAYQNCTIKAAIQLRQTQTYGTFYIQNFMSKITSIQAYGKDFIIAGHSCEIKDLSVALWINQGKIVPPAMPLSLGQNPKILKKQSGKEYAVILQNSMCQSALLINNNDMNKCNFFSQPEFHSLRNVRGLINILQFNIEDLLKNQQIISPCHPKIGLTKIMNGIGADIVQLVSAGSYIVATQYLRVEDQDLVAALFCGGSNFDKVYRYKERSTMITSLYLSNRNDNFGISRMNEI